MHHRLRDHQVAGDPGLGAAHREQTQDVQLALGQAGRQRRNTADDVNVAIPWSPAAMSKLVSRHGPAVRATADKISAQVT
ncbi:MAG TPA: hypothetical protein VH641_15235 [Streptosporangiaceae bacterium]